MEYAEFEKTLKKCIREIAPDADVMTDGDAGRLILPGTDIVPVFYPADYYKQAEAGETDIESAALDIVARGRRTVKQAASLKGLKSFSAVRDILYPRLTNIFRLTRGMIEESVPFRDARLTYYIRLSLDETEGDRELLSVPLTEDMMSDWPDRPDPEEIRRTAFLNAVRDYPPVISDIGSVLGIGEEGDSTFYVLNNPARMLGAISFLYPGELKKTAARLNEDFYVLSSSVHEVLIVPDSLEIPVEELEEMVRDINQGIVSPKDRLSDLVCHYDRSTDALSAAD